ncbi:glycosyltransferase family 4 protein [Candidatus Woesearchaeota archaeon]|nr:glycosyltransferase family 4 protein [Candidatus Woesearchaeota archaeon]
MTSPEFRSSIPFSRYYESRIASIALDIIKKYNIDAVYSHYLLPYGVSALLVKKLTNKPWLLQHAGSDITRLFSFSQLNSIFIECLSNADKIIGYANTMEKMIEHNLDVSKLVHAVRSISLNEFNPNAKPFDFSKYGIGEGTAVFTYFGKISGLKKTYEFINAAAEIKNEDFRIVFVTEAGNNAEELKEHAKKLNVFDKLVFMPFIPPWQVPGIMKASSCIVCPESEETPYLPTTEKQNILVVDPVNKEDFSDMLKFVMRNKEKAEEIGRNARKFSEQNEKFEDYISSFENVLNLLLQ